MASESYYRRKSMRITEAAQAVISLLEIWKCDKPGRSVKKKTLLNAIPGQIQENRRRDGVLSIPTVENVEVKVADATFCKNNWRDIRCECERYGYFIVWNMPGEPQGIRLGTADERQYVQGYTIASTEGFVRTHNETARRLRRFGVDQTVDLQLREEVKRVQDPLQ